MTYRVYLTNDYFIDFLACSHDKIATIVIGTIDGITGEIGSSMCVEVTPNEMPDICRAVELVNNDLIRVLDK